MEIKETQEIIDCLAGERTIYRYHKDKYAFDTLRHLVGSKPSIDVRALRSSPFVKLLQKQRIKAFLRECGDGLITKDRLNNVFEYDNIFYTLTIDGWSGDKKAVWDQVSRPGSNLVLQLNLTESEARSIKALLGEHPNAFYGFCHPLSRRKPATLAWARIDCDFNDNQALIEEVQSDLIRALNYLIGRAERQKQKGNKTMRYWGSEIDVEHTLKLCKPIYETHKNIWQEAMLNATQWFIRYELGIETIFYHSFDTGCLLKDIECSKPPKSLYSDLPTRFCYQKTTRAPEFLLRETRPKRRLKKAKNPWWFKAELGGNCSTLSPI